MDSKLLEEFDWLDAVRGSLRQGCPLLGTCTSTTPASSIDYHVVHEALNCMTTQAKIDMNTKLSPHTPVASVLQVTGGQPVPVQTILKLPSKPVFGPQRQPPCYTPVQDRLDILRHSGKLEDAQAELQGEINEIYEQWRARAVDESLGMEDTPLSEKKGQKG